MTGVSPVRWADIRPSFNQQQMQIDAKQNCQEYAIIGFWKLDPKKDTMVCKRFFIVPNPMKRMIKNTEGTFLYQVLYFSEHTEEVFFFYKGYQAAKDESGKSADESEGEQHEMNEYVTHCAFIDLDQDVEESVASEQERTIDKYCKVIKPLKNESVLEMYLDYLHATDYKDQHQLPNLTVINSSDLVNSDTEGKCVVFTAYLQETHYSGKWQSLRDQETTNPAYKCWYPTVFFYDIF